MTNKTYKNKIRININQLLIKIKVDYNLNYKNINQSIYQNQKMYSRKKAKEQRTDEEQTKQFDQFYKDSNDYYNVVNPQVLKQITTQQKKQMKKILQTKNYKQFKSKIVNWIRSQRGKIQSLLINIKQKQINTNINNQNLQTKYNLQFYPSYKKYFVDVQQFNRIFKLDLGLHHFINNKFNYLQLTSKWYYHLKQLHFGLKLAFFSPWYWQLGKTIGQSINNKHIFDSESFSINYILSDQIDIKTNNKLYSQMYMKMIGYSPRLKKDVKEKSNKQLLKKIDLLEIGYGREEIKEDQKKKFQCQIGTDFYRIYFGKLEGSYSQKYRFGNKISLVSKSSAGVVTGVNTIPHNMFVGKRNTWMGERFRYFINQRKFGIQASSYVNFWMGKGYSNKVKMQLQLGINVFCNEICCCDFTLLKMSGENELPKFGVKFDF